MDPTHSNQNPPLKAATVADLDRWEVDRLMEENPRFEGDLTQLSLLHSSLKKAQSEDRDTWPLRVDWNAWAHDAHEHGPQIDLRGAVFAYQDFRGIELGHADLRGCRFHKCNLSSTYFYLSRLREVRFDDCNMNSCNFEDADLTGAKFTQAKLNRAAFTSSNLNRVDFRNASMVGVSIGGAQCRDADFSNANLEEASFAGSDVSGSSFRQSKLDRSSVQYVKGLRFDGNEVHRISMGPKVPEPWTTLRRLYTGPRFFFHLLLLIAFFTPYIAKFFYLSALSHAQSLLIEHAVAIESHANSWSEELARIADDHGEQVPGIRQLAARFQDEQHGLEAILRAKLASRYTRQRAIAVLTGWSDGWLAFGFAMLLAAYNGCRALLTFYVSGLRDAEERNEVTPLLVQYWWLYRVHQVASILIFAAVGSAVYSLATWSWTTHVYVPISGLPAPQ